MFFQILLPFFLISIGFADGQSSNCQEVSFVLSGTAQNRNLTGDIPFDTVAALQAFYNAAPLITASGSQSIAATYCTPTTSNANKDRLQVLFSSITTNRGSWQAQGGTGVDFASYKPNLYSWVKFANDLGYPTLALDRLGTGKSSHPDPVLVAQAPYEMALYNDLASQIRAGTSQLGRSFSEIIYIGNSYGSQLGAGIAGMYPDAYDTFVLTGFTNSVQKGFVGVALANALPAQIVDAARFGDLPVGYLTTASEIGRTNSFFGSKAQVSFEDTIAHLFFIQKDVVSVGQFLSVYAYPFDGGAFKGRVLVLDGEQDQPFCGPGSPVLGPAACLSQPQDTGALFASADYNYKTVSRIGHAVQLHARSRVLFAVAHDFLAGKEFKGGAPVRQE